MDCVYWQVRFIDFVSMLQGFSNATENLDLNSKYTKILNVQLLASRSGISLVIFVSIQIILKRRKCFGAQPPVARYH